MLNLTARGRTYLAICILSAIFSYLIVTLNHFPYFGMAATLILFALFSYKHKKVKTVSHRLYLAFSLLFSMLIFVRSEPLTTFLNLVAALFFGFLMLLPSQEKSLGFTDFLYAPLPFIIKSLFSRSEYSLEFEKGKGDEGAGKFVEVAFGILISLFLMAIVLPLLSSVNPFFQKIVSDAWNFLGLESLLKTIGLETAFIWLMRLVFFLSFIFIIPKVISLINKKGNYSLPLPFKPEDFPLQIPKLILAIVLTVFFVTQLQFYFASDQTLTSLGISHSQRTREVFAQLGVVAGIVILLIYNSRRKSSFNSFLNWVLGIQGVFLTLMALMSDFNYINTWGLTYRRLYGLAFVAWISGIFVILAQNFRRKAQAADFVKKTIIYSGLILLALNFLNFDYLIYHFQKARTGQGIDYTYLSSLSPDSLSYGQQISKLEEASRQGAYSLEVYDNENPQLIIHKVEYLQNKYSHFDLRTMNLLDFVQYQQIKSLDVSALIARFKN